VYLKAALASPVILDDLGYVGSATSAANFASDGETGLTRRRKDHERNFRRADKDGNPINSRFEKVVAANPGFFELDFVDWFSYKIHDMSKQSGKDHMKVMCLFADAFWAEAPKAHSWSTNGTWLGTCSHSCLLEGK
jgi:hypothetical protein